MPNGFRVLEADPLHPKAIKMLREAGMQVRALNPYGSADALLEALPETEVLLVRSSFYLDAALLQKANQLLVVGRAGAGMEQIDVQAAANRGITCFNSPEGNRDAVAEQVVGMLLCLWQHLCRSNSEVRRGIWNRLSNRGTELMGKTVGIVGLGHTGGQLAKKLQGFGVRCLANDPYRIGPWPAYVEKVELYQLMEESDVVSLHVPLTEETKGLVNRAWLQQLPKRPVLINTSRGGVVHTEDLVEALEQGWISGACLDVLEFEGKGFEGLSSEKLPNSWQKLIDREDVLLSPHTAGWTHESWEKISTVLAGKIIEALRDRQLGV